MLSHRTIVLREIAFRKTSHVAIAMVPPAVGIAWQVNISRPL